MTDPPSAPAPRGMRQRLIRNSAILLGGTGGAAVLALLTAMINSRALTIGDFGLFALLQSSALLVAGLTSFSTQQPITKLGIAAIDRGQRSEFEELVGLGYLADFASAALAAALAVAAVLILPELTDIPASAHAAALLVAASLIFQGYRTSEGLFRVFDRFDLLASIQFGSAAVAVIMAAVLWFTDAPFIAYAILVCVMVCLPSILQLIVALWLLRNRGFQPRLARRSLDRPRRREFFHYCWTTSAIGSLDTIRQNGDAALVASIVSVEAVGIYNVAKQIAGILRKAVIVYASVMFPEIAILASREGRSVQARRLLLKAAAASIAVAVVVGLAASILGGAVLHLLFGTEFAAGRWILALLAAAAGIQLVSSTYSMFVQVYNGPAALLWGYLWAALVFVVLFLSLVPALGLVGAGVAHCVFFVVLTAVCALQLRLGGRI